MKNIITLAVSLFSFTIFAQVGINNNTPKATLDITAQTTNGSKPEGLLAPRLTGDQIQAGDAQYTAAQKGLIIYATAAPTAPSGKTANMTAEGYYFFDGTAWQKITGAAAGDTTNDAWINDTGNAMVKVGTKADGTARSAGTDFVVKDDGKVGIGTAAPTTNLDVIGSEIRLRGGDDPVLRIHSAANAADKGGSIEFNENNANYGIRMRHYTDAGSGYNEGLHIESKIAGTYSPIATFDETNKSVGIGTTTPNTSAALDISSTNKGLLPPRVALSARNVWSLTGSPTDGMIIYNNANSGTATNIVEAGFLYVWNNSLWNKLQKADTDTNSGMETKKIQYYGNFDSSKTVVSGPFEFRTINNGSNILRYQYRLITAPTGNVSCSIANTTNWGGTNPGATALRGSNSTDTFTTVNWNTWTDIADITTGSLNANVCLISVDTANLPGWVNIPIFYNIIVQQVGSTTSGLKTMIINRY